MRNFSINGPLVVGVGSRVSLDDVIDVPKRAHYRNGLKIQLVMQPVNGWLELDKVNNKCFVYILYECKKF